MLQTGDQASGRRFPNDIDGLGKIRALQPERRPCPPVWSGGARVPGQVEAADAADGPCARGAFSRGEADFRQQRRAGRPALGDRSAFDFHREGFCGGSSADGRGRP